MPFQNYVYTLVCEDTGMSFGSYPNFKKAYEAIEEREEGKIIVDCGCDYTTRVCFNVINPKLLYTVKSYSIYINLLTIYNEKELVTYGMVKELEEANKTRAKNSNYRLKGEVL